MMSVSASQLKDFTRCPRAWFLKTIARAPDDAAAGGKYLVQGTALDELVQLHQSRLTLEPDYVRAAAHRAHPHVSAEGLTEAVDLAFRQLAALHRSLPTPKSHAVQFSYSIPVPQRPEVRIVGRPDLRQPGRIVDLKTTSDRGPGRGCGLDRPAYALTDLRTEGGNLRPLAEDVQAALYAWCEVQLDLQLDAVHAEWLYVSKTPAPKHWSTAHSFTRAEVDGWFESWVLPRLDAMADLRARAAEGATAAAADQTGCTRCFVKLSCDPYAGPQVREKGAQVFNLKALQEKQKSGAAAPAAETTAASTLVEQLQASLLDHAINRPRSVEDRLTALEARLAALEVVK